MFKLNKTGGRGVGSREEGLMERMGDLSGQIPMLYIDWKMEDKMVKGCSHIEINGWWKQQMDEGYKSQKKGIH